MSKKFWVLLVEEVQGEVQTTEVQAKDREDCLCTVEDVLADLHRKHVPGFEYWGFTEDEAPVYHHEGQCFATVVPVQVNKQPGVHCMVYCMES